MQQEAQVGRGRLGARDGQEHGSIIGAPAGPPTGLFARCAGSGRKPPTPALRPPCQGGSRHVGDERGQPETGIWTRAADPHPVRPGEYRPRRAKPEPPDPYLPRSEHPLRSGPYLRPGAGSDSERFFPARPDPLRDPFQPPASLRDPFQPPDPAPTRGQAGPPVPGGAFGWWDNNGNFASDRDSHPGNSYPGNSHGGNSQHRGTPGSGIPRTSRSRSGPAMPWRAGRRRTRTGTRPTSRPRSSCPAPWPRGSSLPRPRRPATGPGKPRPTRSPALTWPGSRPRALAGRAAGAAARGHDRPPMPTPPSGPRQEPEQSRRPG